MTRLSQEQIQYVIDHFANTSNKDLAEQAGIGKSTVSRIQSEYRLKKSAEYTKERYHKCGMASLGSQCGLPLGASPEAIKKRVATYKQIFREEKARWIFGLPQRTRIKVRSQPLKKRKQRSYLKHLGYLLDEVNNIAYYTDETKRAVKMEKYTSRNKCYYKFMPYEQQ